MKVWTYLAIMIGMMTFLYFLGMGPTGAGNSLSGAGIVINQTTGALISGDIGASNWFSDLFGDGIGILVALSTLGVIVVGLYTRSFEWKLVVLPFFLGTIAKFVSFGWAIVEMAEGTEQGWLVAIVATVFLPLTAMFIFSIVEWFGGSPSD